jgi:hypothetical protein
MSLNEWPAPATRSARPAAAARLIASATSASLAGASIDSGAQRWSPAQFRHSSGIGASIFGTA